MIEIYIIDYKTGRGALRSGRPPEFTQIWAKTRQIDIIIIIKIRGKMEGIYSTGKKGDKWEHDISEEMQVVWGLRCQGWEWNEMRLANVLTWRFLWQN